MKKSKMKSGLSYRSKWIITIITMLIADILVAICISQGMFTFKPGSVTANDKEEPLETEIVDEDSGDELWQNEYTVFISEGNGGTAEPNGRVKVEAWGSTTVNFTPDEGYAIQSVTVDGEDVGAVTSYTLSYVTSDHTIMVTFEQVNADKPDSDDDADE